MCISLYIIILVVFTVLFADIYINLAIFNNITVAMLRKVGANPILINNTIIHVTEPVSASILKVLMQIFIVLNIIFAILMVESLLGEEGE